MVKIDTKHELTRLKPSEEDWDSFINRLLDAFKEANRGDNR